VSPYAFPGLVSELVAIWTFVAVALVALAAAIRWAAVRRVPGKGRLARGLVVAAPLAAAFSIALFAAAEAIPPPWKRTVDLAAPFLALGTVALVGFVAAAVARRSRPPVSAGVASAPPPAPGAPPPPGAAPPTSG
jgi:hypothetical protein